MAEQQQTNDPMEKTLGLTKQQVAVLKPKEQVKYLLEQNKQVIAQALPRHLNPERLMRVAITSVTSVPALLECYVPTLIGGIIQCSAMGLEPNTVLGHAYLVPFWNEKQNRKDAQVIVGYKGLIDLARRSGQIVSIAAHAVYKNDKFVYEYGLDEKLAHIPAEGDRGEITHFYAVAHMRDGGHAFEVMTAGAVKKIRDQAAKKNRAKTDSEGNLIIKGPWKDFFEEMGRKTAIRRLAKYLPLSVEMAQAVAMGDAEASGASQNLESALTGDYTVETGDEDDDAAERAAAEAAAKRKTDSNPLADQQRGDGVGTGDPAKSAGGAETKDTKPPGELADAADKAVAQADKKQRAKKAANLFGAE